MNLSTLSISAFASSLLAEVFHEGSYSGVLQSVAFGIFFNKQKSSTLSDQGGRIKFIGSLDTPGPCGTRGEEEGRLVVFAGPQAARTAGRSRCPLQPGRAPGSARWSGRSLTGRGRRAHRAGHLAFVLRHKEPRCAGSPGWEWRRAPVGKGAGCAAGQRRCRAAGGERGARAEHGSSPSLPKTSPIPAPPFPREEQSRHIRQQGSQP